MDNYNIMTIFADAWSRIKGTRWFTLFIIVVVAVIMFLVARHTYLHPAKLHAQITPHKNPGSVISFKAFLDKILAPIQVKHILQTEKISKLLLATLIIIVATTMKFMTTIYIQRFWLNKVGFEGIVRTLRKIHILIFPALIYGAFYTVKTLLPSSVLVGSIFLLISLPLSFILSLFSHLIIAPINLSAKQAWAITWKESFNNNGSIIIIASCAILLAKIIYIALNEIPIVIGQTMPSNLHFLVGIVDIIYSVFFLFWFLPFIMLFDGATTYRIVNRYVSP